LQCTAVSLLARGIYSRKLNWKWMTIMHNIVIVSLTKCLRRKTMIFITRVLRLCLHVIWYLIDIFYLFCRRSWFYRLTPNDVVLGLIVANAAIFLFWRIASEKFMLNNFTVSLLIYKFYSIWWYLEIYLRNLCFVCNSHLWLGLTNVS
jgi:hypothetical protein